MFVAFGASNISQGTLLSHEMFHHIDMQKRYSLQVMMNELIVNPCFVLF